MWIIRASARAEVPKRSAACLETRTAGPGGDLEPRRRLSPKAPLGLVRVRRERVSGGLGSSNPYPLPQQPAVRAAVRGLQQRPALQVTEPGNRGAGLQGEEGVAAQCAGRALLLRGVQRQVKCAGTGGDWRGTGYEGHNRRHVI